jgi:hypothetical protein
MLYICRTNQLKLRKMAQGTTITNTKTGEKGFFPTEIIPELKSAAHTWREDAAGLYEVGDFLSSTFTSYCEIEKMQALMDASGQTYKADASTYVARYNRLFNIDNQ